MDKLKLLEKHVKGALFWGSFEAIAFRALLLTHQLMLFWTVDKAFYGLQGTVFASIFLMVNLLNGSLCSALTSIFTKMNASKKNFNYVLKYYVATQTAILFFGTLLIGFLFQYFPFSASVQQLATPFWIFILGLFIASEGTKKNLRAILHLAFKNKITAQIEVAFVTVYIAIIWLLHFAGLKFSLPLLIFPFLFLSFGVNLFLLFQLFTYYTTLSNENCEKEGVLKKDFLINRTFLYMNEIGRSFFSSNFLLPFFAYSSGLAQAGLASCINELTYSMSFFVQKVFGPSGAALFANTKNLSFENKQAAFSYLNQKCLYVIGSLVVLFIINMPQVFFLRFGSQSIHTWTIIYVFFLAHFLENLFIVYEKFFVVEEKAHYITYCNMVSFAGCLLIAFLLKGNSVITILLLCLLMRLLAFMGLVYVAQKLWRLRPQFNLSPFQFCAPFALSSILFAVLWFIA